MNSILNTIKKMLGPTEEYTHFDPDIIISINTQLMSLKQLGVGPKEGFSITSELETWRDFLGDRKDLEAVKTYIYLNVRLEFDPPTSSAHIEVINRKIKELEFRLNVQAEDT